MAGGECVVEGRRAFRLDRDEANAALIPGGDAADQPAPSRRDEQRVDLGCIGLDLAADRPLPEQGFGLVISVDLERAIALGKILAGAQRIGVKRPLDDQFGAVAADAVELRRRGNLRHKDRRTNAEPHRGISNRGAVVAARCRHNPGRWRRAGEEARESAARLEGAGVL